MKKIISFFLLFSLLIVHAQKKPKLAIGIVVDQMRYDYLLRFKSKFGNKGFNKLIAKGTTYENGHFNYIPTYTAVGHSSIYTGTTPKNHGILSNSWYDKSQKKSFYVVDDSNYTTVGSTSKLGAKSPHRLLASTVSDQLKIAQNFKGKSIGIAIKDRSAILPVGHTADIAYWFEGGQNGKWITSSFYTDKLPNWVETYNTQNKATLDSYLSTPWVTKRNKEEYTECTVDDNHFEGRYKSEKKPIFPHDLPSLKKKNGNYSILKITPFGNTMTLDFAKKIIEQEKLGQDEIHSDFLAISLSSTDYIGHKYGPASLEIEDTYIRLNDDLDDFIEYLNSTLGKNEYVLFLTADHAVVQIPLYLMEHKFPGGYFPNKIIRKNLTDYTLKKYKSSKLIENVSNNQIFLNRSEIISLNLSVEMLENELIDELLQHKDIYKAVSAHTLQRTEFNNAPLSLLQEGYNQKLSGDILYTLKPTIISQNYIKGGTTHGTGYNYDTHVPIIFYGANINKGKTVKKSVNITQIAPTLSNLLQIQEPNMSSLEILTEVFDKK